MTATAKERKRSTLKERKGGAKIPAPVKKAKRGEVKHVDQA